MDKGECRTIDMISDKSIDVENETINKIMIEAVLEAIKTLDDEEKLLIQELFFCGNSERELAKEMGISKTGLHHRKLKVLSKIKKQIKV